MAAKKKKAVKLDKKNMMGLFLLLFLIVALILALKATQIRQLLFPSAKYNNYNYQQMWRRIRYPEATIGPRYTTSPEMKENLRLNPTPKGDELLPPPRYDK